MLFIFLNLYRSVEYSHSSPPRDQICVSYIAGSFFHHWATKDSQNGVCYAVDTHLLAGSCVCCGWLPVSMDGSVDRNSLISVRNCLSGVSGMVCISPCPRQPLPSSWVTFSNQPLSLHPWTFLSRTVKSSTEQSSPRAAMASPCTVQSPVSSLAPSPPPQHPFSAPASTHSGHIPGKVSLSAGCQLRCWLITKLWTDKV